MLDRWMRNRFFSDFGLLVLRVAAGLFLAIKHGYPKLIGFNDLFHSFASPIGVGPEVSYLLTVGAEVGCALLVVLGFFTRLASVPLVILFGVIAFVVQADKPFGERELPLLFMAMFFAIFLIGPGRFAVDSLFRRGRE